MQPDFLIVGTGLTGAVFAHTLRDAGFTTVAVDRRSHPGGNVHDKVHGSGIRMHTYGPHYFRTSSDRIWDFVNRFTMFYSYEAQVKSLVNGACENWPVAASYIRREIGEKWECDFQGIPANFEEAALSLMPRKIYESFVKEYNEKQWGVAAAELSADLCTRFDVRQDDDPRLTPRAKYQGLPTDGYASMMIRMWDDIPLLLEFDYLKQRDAIRPRIKTIFTGPVDEYFEFALGKLRYRGQMRKDTFLADTDRYQEAAQINVPSHAGGPHIRTLEWKQMLPAAASARLSGTLITRETPFSPEIPDQYEYPFPDEENCQLHLRYCELAAQCPDVLICGRLGEYKYYDMDQAIARAMTLAGRLVDDLRGRTRLRE